jgi:hypothetical protein
MRATNTLVIDLGRLQRAGPEATLIVRLMMASNDLTLANLGLVYFSEDQPRLQKHVQPGARHYFMMLQCGHLNEAMKLIEKVSQSVNLSNLVKQCTSPTQEAYRRLTDCLSGGVQNNEFRKYIGAIRNRVVFHYDDDVVKKAIEDRAARLEARHSMITQGTDASLWRHNLADDIVESIVCRQLWKIPRSADLSAAADRNAEFCRNLCEAFVNFANEFTVRYIREHAVV